MREENDYIPGIQSSNEGTTAFTDGIWTETQAASGTMTHVLFRAQNMYICSFMYRLCLSDTF